MRVLLVEDNALTRFTIRSLVEKLGHEVVGEAEDGAAALQKFSELKPDVVFLDLILPGKSGLEVLAEIKAVSGDSRVVVVTAVEQEEIDRQLSDKGVNAILRKPFSFEDFKKLMSTLV